MSNIWVYRFDGTIQYNTKARMISLEKMRDQLVALIGETNVLAMKRTLVPMPQLCGMPTGNINAYEITPDGWFFLQKGPANESGFKKLDEYPR